MDTSVYSLLPTSILDARVPANIVSVSFTIGHALATFLLAIQSCAPLAVRVTIWETIGSHSFNEGVGRKDKLDLPISIRSRKHLHVKVTMLIDVLLLY